MACYIICLADCLQRQIHRTFELEKSFFFLMECKQIMLHLQAATKLLCIATTSFLPSPLSSPPSPPSSPPPHYHPLPPHHHPLLPTIIPSLPTIIPSSPPSSPPSPPSSPPPLLPTIIPSSLLYSLTGWCGCCSLVVFCWLTIQRTVHECPRCVRSCACCHGYLCPHLIQ